MISIGIGGNKGLPKEWRDLAGFVQENELAGNFCEDFWQSKVVHSESKRVAVDHNHPKFHVERRGKARLTHVAPKGEGIFSWRNRSSK